MVNQSDAWMMTYTGKKFHFLDPQPDEIDIVDIAHHLSLLCRFTGACKYFYSVAEHSVRVAGIVRQHLKLSALLHDAAEAYINDISRPVKHTHKLDKTEKIVMDAIVERYKITPYAREIEKADDILVATEARDLMADPDAWFYTPEPLEGKIDPWTSPYAEEVFLRAFNSLYGEHR